MRTLKSLLIVSAIILLVVTAIGCGRPEVYGEKISNRTITPIKDILSHPEQYTGKPVTVQGKIGIECPSGCWFKIEEGGLSLKTDLQPGGFAIPQKVGRRVIVEGTMSIEEGQPLLVSKGVEIR